MGNEAVKQIFIKEVRSSYLALAVHFNERSLRIWTATEARRYGKGGISAVHTAIGIDHKTIRRGIKELDCRDALPSNRIRKKGGGRKRITKTDKTVSAALDAIIDPVTQGDPESLLLWTSKSLTNLTEELNEKGHVISRTTVRKLLIAKDYKLQPNRKKLEGIQHPDRNDQFLKISDLSKRYQKNNCPVLSVDAKKKENIGQYKNNGKEYSPQGKPIYVNTHDFANKKLGKVAPFGIYDIGKNEGWVSVGISSDTASFAVNSIRTWWYVMGEKLYKKAESIMITADCGGSNSNRTKLWKWELQKFANEVNKKICVCHFPPGTSKWNKIEHKMFSYISMNWRARPLISRETVVNLIANTRTKSGLKIGAALDENLYKTGVKVSKSDFDSINIKADDFHGEWNYIISPQRLTIRDVVNL